MMRKNSLPRKNATFRFFAWLQIFLQVLFPLVSMVSSSAFAQSSSSSSANLSPFAVDRNSSSTTKDTTALPYGDTMSSLANSLSSNGAEGVASSAKSAAAGYASSSTQQWLSQFGTARVQLNVDDNGNWDDSAIDFLAPLYDNKKSMLFTQLGLRAPDGRITGNMGMGVRTFYVEDWMFGGNVFFDDDFTGKNRRVGVGAEAWTNNLKLSANTYVGTTDWHSSRDFNDYYEKPADGYDVRAEGYLPSYPQLGAKLMYEQYYGNNVALFDKDHLQSDPSAVTVGLSYTPVPLITAAVDYKRGQDSMDETTFGINFRYTLGQPWAEQISPSQVAIQRSLAGSRYDLVERNNEIVLQYKKKQQDDALSDMTLMLAKDNSPADGTSANIVTVHASTESGAPARNTPINWSTTGKALLSTSTSVTDSNGDASINVTNKSAEQVIVQANSGNITRTTTTTFTQSVDRMDLQLTQNNSIADGNAQNAGLVTVKDANGQAMPNMPIAWKVSNGASIVRSDAQTNAKGQATVHFVNTKAGTVTLTAGTSGKNATVDATFVAAAVSKIDVSMKTNNTIADGRSTNEAQAIVRDSANNPMPNVSVTWHLGNSQTAQMDSPSVVTTDANGVALVRLKDTVAETVSVTANAGGSTGTTQAVFSATPVNLVTVSMTTNNSPADNATNNAAQALITDSNGQPMPNVSVTWTISGSATASLSSAATVTTNASGIAVVTLKDSVKESVNLTASAGGKTGKTTATFIQTVAKNLAVSMTGNNAIADNSALNTVQAVLTDGNGNPVENAVVTWSMTGSSTASFTSSTSVNTNSSGIATVSLKDSVAEPVTITASADGITNATTATFIAVPTGAVVVSMTTNHSPADGTTANVAQAVVTDSHGQPLKNITVNWSLSGSSTASATSPTTAITNASGIATLSLVDTTAGGVTVIASADGKQDQATATFQAPIAAIAVSVTTNNSPADGTTANTAQAVVTDAKGLPVANTSVTWSLSGSSTANATSPTTVTTNSSGIATLTLVDSAAEGVTVTASAGGKQAQATATFIAPVSAIAMAVTINNSPADNATANTVQATVTGPNGLPVENASLTWTLSGSSTATTTSPTVVTTNSSGIATLTLVDSVAEGVTVTASAGGKQNQAMATFTAVPVNTVAVTMTTNNAKANGIDTNVAQASVTDASNHPIANVPVTWNITGSTTANATTSLTTSTDANGFATLSLTDTVAEDVTLTAHAGGKQGQTTATFASDAFGPVTVELEHAPASQYINANTVSDGLDITVDAYPGMAEGDQITVNFNVTGTLDPDSTNPLPNVTLPVHTVTAAEVGKPIAFTIDGSTLIGVQADTNKNPPLESVATAIVVKPSTQRQVTGTSPTYIYDTK
jgi:adhesin/invasin